MEGGKEGECGQERFWSVALLGITLDFKWGKLQSGKEGG